MNEGDIALAVLPQANGQVKNRPVILLRRLPPYGDFLVYLYRALWPGTLCEEVRTG